MPEEKKDNVPQAERVMYDCSPKQTNGETFPRAWETDCAILPLSMKFFPCAAMVQANYTEKGKAKLKKQSELHQQAKLSQSN